MHFDDYQFERDCEGLVRGLPAEERESAEGLFEAAVEQAKSGNLTAAAESIESIRRLLVARNNFRRHDNDIWVFTDVMRTIRHMAPKETPVPAEYRRLLEAVPSARMDDDMTPSQKQFWYGDADANVGGEIRVVAPGPEAPPQKGCFIVTAACGSDRPEVEAFRRFRDGALLRMPGGAWFVEWYYRWSPGPAGWLESRPALRAAVRACFVTPVAAVLRAAGFSSQRRPHGMRTSSSRRSRVSMTEAQ